MSVPPSRSGPLSRSRAQSNATFPWPMTATSVTSPRSGGAFSQSGTPLYQLTNSRAESTPSRPSPRRPSRLSPGQPQASTSALYIRSSSSTRTSRPTSTFPKNRMRFAASSADAVNWLMTLFVAAWSGATP